MLRGTENTKVGIVAERPASAASGGKGEKLDLIVTRRKFKVEGVIPREATIDGRKVGVRVVLDSGSGHAVHAENSEIPNWYLFVMEVDLSALCCYLCIDFFLIDTEIYLPIYLSPSDPAARKCPSSLCRGVCCRLHLQQHTDQLAAYLYLHLKFRGFCTRLRAPAPACVNTQYSDSADQVLQWQHRRGRESRGGAVQV